ncbi:MAG: hypothetical protein QX197_02840 [Methylococcaceae bacterium]
MTTIANTPESLLSLQTEHPLYQQALAFVGNNKSTTCSALQRHLKKGYNFTTQLRALLVTHGVLEELMPITEPPSCVIKVLTDSASATFSLKKIQNTAGEEGVREVIQAEILESDTVATELENSATPLTIVNSMVDAINDPSIFPVSFYDFCQVMTGLRQRGYGTIKAARSVTYGSDTVSQAVLNLVSNSNFMEHLHRADGLLVIIISSADSLSMQTFQDIALEIQPHIVEHVVCVYTVRSDLSMALDALKIELFAAHWPMIERVEDKNA